MSTILLSFEADWFKKLESGEKKFEYRKHFPKGKTTVYFYVSQPIKAITGKAIFGERESLLDWKERYQGRPQEVVDRIEEMLEDCRYAMPMYSFQATTKIPLDQLREDIPDFVVPRMYYYLDDLPLLDYLEKKLVPISKIATYTFDNLTDDDIC